jgi:2-C-methyl-D-erythritol 4-phosphate cytidylyltransferase
MPDNTAPQADIWAVVPAGGCGSRYATGRDKLLVPLEGVPILARTVLALLEVPSLTGVVVVCSAANLERYRMLLADHAPQAMVRFAVGGATRRESVYNGLLALPDSADVVVVHDAARPLVRSDLVTEVLQCVLNGKPGAIAAIPIHDTIKEASGEWIGSTLDRSRLWRAQTPQVFRFSPLLQAHRRVPATESITDDAQLMELAGLGPVAIVPGDERNLKITRPLDVLMAEAFLRADAVPLV